MPELRQIIEAFVSRVHIWVFREPPGEGTRKFVNNVFYMSAGVFGGTLITFLFSIWVVRSLGPTEYGKYNLVVSVAQFLLIPLLFGLPNAAARYLARETESRKEIASSILIIFAFLAALFLTIFWTAQSNLAHIFRVDISIFRWAVLLGAAIAASHMIQAILRGLEKFKKLAWLEICSAMVYAAAITYVLGIKGDYSFAGVTASNIIRWLAVFILGSAVLPALFTKPSLKWSKEVLHFGAYHAFMGFAGFFFLGMIDNVMLNYYLGPTVVGIYGAYYVAFSVFTGKILHSFMSVFYPAASTREDAGALFKKIAAGLPKIGAATFTFVIVLVWTLFRLYGKEYPFVWVLAALISLNITIHAALTMLGGIIGSRGIAGARFLTYTLIAAGAVNVILNAALIPVLQITGVMLATTAASILLFIFYWRWLRELPPASSQA